MLAEVNRSYPAWFGFLQPYSFLDSKGVLAALGGVNSTKVPGTDPSYWELVFSEFSNVFENPGTLLERAIKHEIDLPPDCVPLAKN